MSVNWPEWLIGLPLTWDVGLRMTAVLSVTWVIHIALAGRNPRWRALLWRLTAVGLVMIPLLELAMPKVQLPVEPTDRLLGSSAAFAWDDPWLTSAQFDPTADMTMAEEPINLAFADSNSDSLSEVAIAPAEGSSNSASAASYKLWWSLWACWGIGACVLACRWCAAQWRVRRKLADCATAPERCLRVLRKTGTKLGCSRQVGLRISTDSDVPFVTGLLRPVIVLPVRMADPENVSELPAILAHELAHHKSQDLIWMGLLHWVEILLWFHPLVWRISKVHSIACEEVADATAARLVGDATEYSGTLARVALLAIAPPPAAATIPMARSPEIITRLARLNRGLLFSPLARRSVLISVVLAMVALLALVGFELVLAESKSIAAEGSWTIEFPKDRSVGKVSIALEEEPSWISYQRGVDYQKHWNWVYLSQGQAAVTIPVGAKVKLHLSAAGAQDMSWTSQLDPEDLHTLEIYGPYYNGFPFGDVEVKHLSRLTGLQELVLMDARVTDRGMKSLESLGSLKRLMIFSPNLGNAGLRHVGRLTSLEVLVLGKGKWDDSGLAHLSKLNSLREFSYSASQVRGPGLKHIARLPSLIYVDSGAPQFTDRHLAYWSRAKSLKGLRLQTAGVTDAGLKQLRNLKHLEYLDLWGTGITDAGLVHLKPLRSLKRLNVRVRYQGEPVPLVTVRGVAQVAEIPSLEHLDLPNGEMTDECCEYVSQLKNLKYLWIGCGSNTAITDEGLQHLARLENLENLHIGGTGITDDGMPHVAALTQLKRLALTYAPRVSNNGIAKLGALKSLETLALPYKSRITSSGLSQLNGLSHLRLLNFSPMEPTAPEEEALDISDLTRLEQLTLPPVRDEDLACLSEMKSLQWLTLINPSTGGATVGDKGLAHLSGLTSLRRLNIGSPEMTDAGLAHLVGMHQLYDLSVTGQFTDQGVADLENLKGLEVLRIYSGKNLSATAKQSLQQNLPNLRHFTADNDRVFQKKRREGNRGKVAPAFEATTLDGKEIKLDDYGGKVVLLYFWSTSCTPCIKSAPSLKKYHDQKKDEHPDFEMISISTDDSDQRVRIHIEEHEHSWPQVRVGVNSKLAADYGVEGLPRYVLVGRDGIIKHDGKSRDLEKRLRNSLER